LEKALKAARAREASSRGKEVLAQAENIGGIPCIVVDLGPVDGEYLQAVSHAIKGGFPGVCLLAGTANGSVSLVATVSKEFQSRIQAGKMIRRLPRSSEEKAVENRMRHVAAEKMYRKVPEALAHARNLLAA